MARIQLFVLSLALCFFLAFYGVDSHPGAYGTGYGGSSGYNGEFGIRAGYNTGFGNSGYNGEFGSPAGYAGFGSSGYNGEFGSPAGYAGFGSNAYGGTNYNNGFGLNPYSQQLGFSSQAGFGSGQFDQYGNPINNQLGLVDPFKAAGQAINGNVQAPGINAPYPFQHLKQDLPNGLYNAENVAQNAASYGINPASLVKQEIQNSLYHGVNGVNGAIDGALGVASIAHSLNPAHKIKNEIRNGLHNVDYAVSALGNSLNPLNGVQTKINNAAYNSLGRVSNTLTNLNNDISGHAQQVYH